ncbi:MAG: calcium-binding EGF-like domain-containing protein, partial [Actinomycetota bacterium]|nr:calcium-binding EGF-like domain-containing protein [Actinomycetota bacterium]
MYYKRTLAGLVSDISIHTYRCNCAPGYANGACAYSFIKEYTTECTVAESTQNSTLTGNCDMDVNECKSSPCANGATCSDSTTETPVSIHAYQCTCMPGFSNGVCEYNFLQEFKTECTVMESSSNPSLRGNCDIDVNECASSPCANGATCTESHTEQGLVRYTAFTRVSVTETSVGGIAGHTTYSLSVGLAGDAANMHTIYGSKDHAMKFPKAYQDTVAGVDIGGVSPAVWRGSPKSKYDSWLTVGETKGVVQNDIVAKNINFGSWATTPLTVTDGSVTWAKHSYGGAGYNEVILSLPEADAPTSLLALYYYKTTYATLSSTLTEL